MRYSVLFLFFLVASCNQCTKEEVKPQLQSTGDAMVDEAFLNGLDTQEIQNENEVTLPSDENLDANVTTTKVVKTRKEAIADSVYSSKLKDSISKSKNRDKSCAEIMVAFEEVVNRAIAAKDIGLIKKEGWNIKDDVKFLSCQKIDKDFKEKYYQLTTKLKKSIK